MRNTISKAIVAGVAALSLATAVVATPSRLRPAVAWRRLGGGWRGGGGWHGGRLARRRLARRLAWRRGRVWHPGYWRNGGWYGGWWGPAVAAGLAAGAITAPYWRGWGGERLLAGPACVRRLTASTSATSSVNVCQ